MLQHAHVYKVAFLLKRDGSSLVGGRAYTLNWTGDQMLSREEFQEAVLYNERVKQKLDILEIGPDEAL
eukprot:6412527-Amphidinium_carterae.1